MHLTHLRLRGRPAVTPPFESEARSKDPTGAVRFRTEIAKQRFIRLETMSDEVVAMAWEIPWSA